MALLFENYTPYIKDNKGITTKLPVILSGTAATLAVGGTLTVTGATTVQTMPAPIASTGATVALTAAQSGNTFLYDRASGVVYTLPVGTVGMNFTFVTTVTITSGAAEVAVNNEAGEFIQGAITVVSTTSNTFAGNGTTHVEVTSNGTTTGGVLGGQYTLTCIAVGLWQAEGWVVGSGTAATPFSV